MKEQFVSKKTLIYKDPANMYNFENDLFSLEVFYCTFLDMYSPEHAYSQPMHNHHNYELYMILKGSCTIEVANGKTYDVKQGNFIAIPPTAKHRITYESPDFSKLSLRFNMYAKNKVESNFYVTAINMLKQSYMFKYNENMKDYVLSIIDNSNKNPHEHKTTIFLQIISFIIEALRVVVGNTKIVPNRKYNDIRIDHALDYIEDNISASLNVSDVAEYLHLSTKQFTRIFTKAIGVSPGIYMRDFRVERIKELLTTTNLQLEDIVEIMGYSDSVSLIKAFKRAEGNTPMKYKMSVIE